MKKNKKLIHLHIILEVSEGERKHDHRVLTQTYDTNVHRAVRTYAKNFWGESVKEDEYYVACGGEITIKISKFTILSQFEYDFLSNLYSES